MSDKDNKPLGPGLPGQRVLSIVERIEQRQMERLREQSAKLHVREVEAVVEWLDLKRQLESMDLDAELAEPPEADTPEVRRQRGILRCMRGFRSCLRDEVDAGQAEWSAVAAEVPDLALPHLLRARWCMQTEPRDAFVHFDRAAEIEPREPNVYWRRGDCYAKVGDHERALANYRRALALDPGSIDGLHAMGKALVALGKPAEAIRYYDQAITRAPRYVDFYEARAIALEVLDQFAAAVRDYDRILELDPSRVISRFPRARCLAELGDVDRAVDDLTQLVATNPDSHHVHLLLGKLLLKKQQLAEARDALSRAIDLAPAEPEAWGSRAFVFVRLGMRDQALADAEHAVELAPDRPEYTYTLIALRHDGRDRAAKISALDGAIAKFPDAPLFLEERAELYAKSGDHERALADWERLIAAWPRDAGAAVGRAKALGSLARYAEAVEEASRAVDLAPDNGMAHGLRANYREHLEGEEALIDADWARAGELAPDDLAIRYYRGHYLMGRERYTAAVADFDRLVTLAPDYAEAFYHRAYARFRIDEEHFDDDDWDEPEEEHHARCRACVADLQRALELGYAQDDALSELHWAHRALGDNAAALADLDRGVAAYPDLAWFYRLRQFLRREMNDTAGAEADQARADALAPPPPSTPPPQ